MSYDNYYKGPCAHCDGTGWYDGEACWCCEGQGTAIRSREEIENGEHRTADTPPSGGAAQQPNPGGPPHLAALAQHLAYLSQQRAIAQQSALFSAIANAQQGAGVGWAQMQDLGQAMQNAPWANQYGMPYATTSMLAIVGGPFTSGLAQHGWVDPVPPLPIEDAGISAGEILGHRVWRYGNVGHLLQSMAKEHIWPPSGPLHDPKVGDHNTHGIHAFKTAEGVINEYQPNRGFWGIKLVYGTVALWGTVIEHERGYRGEFARIHSLDSIPQLFRWKELRLLREIRQRYGLTA